jgi:hypothetical protein
LREKRRRKEMMMDVNPMRAGMGAHDATSASAQQRLETATRCGARASIVGQGGSS